MFDISAVSAELQEVSQTSFDVNALSNGAGQPNAHSIFAYNASEYNLDKATQILENKSGGDIFYSSINEIKIESVSQTSMTDNALESIKDVRDGFRENYEKVAAPIDSEVNVYEAMLKKQMDVAVASLEIELTSKIAGKTIENTMMLLRQ